MERVARTFNVIRNNNLLLVGVIVFAVILLPVIFAPYVTPYEPNELRLGNEREPPSVSHPMGTDNFGQDVLTQVLFGARTSLLIAFSGVTMAFLIGVTVGISAGYFGGWVDELLMRLVDTVMVFPAFVLALLLAPTIGSGALAITIAIGIVFSPNFARITRGSTLSIKEEKFIEAAKVLGFSDTRIMISDIFPNIIAPILVQASVASGYAIIIEAGLTFLGVGVEGTSLGAILAVGRQFLTSAPWIVIMTGLFITAIVLSLNLIGDGLRDVIDPELEDEVQVKQ